MPYVRKRKRKPKRLLKETMKLYGVLMIVCFLIAGILFFISRKIPEFTQVIMNKAVESEAERVLGRKLTDKEQHGIAADKGMMEKAKKALGR